MSRITAANAKAMAAKSHFARRQRRSAWADAGESSVAPPENAQNCDSYAERRLSRVRMQLDRVDEMVMKEKDPQKLDRLASAQARLSEQERVLAGRPLPGAFRPVPQRAKRSDSACAQPIE
jgi:hypothetical protein